MNILSFFKKLNADVYNLNEYKLSKKILKEGPEIIKKLERARNILESHKDYKSISSVISFLEEAKLMVDLQHKYYEKIFKSKGKVK